MRILLVPFFTYFNVAYFVPGEARSGCLAMPPEDGDCDTDTNRWYYDSREGKCQNFMYGDCPPTGNDFPTKEECESNCKGKGQQMPQRPEKPPKFPPKGHKPPSKWTKPPKGGQGTNRPGKGSEEENEVIKGPGGGGRYRPRPPMGPWPPRKRPQKPWPRPPSKGPGAGSCAARAVRKKWGKSCSGYGGMWFNNAGFYTCSRVKEGYCPTVGTFYATCEECMGACQPLKIKQCQYYR